MANETKQKAPRRYEKMRDSGVEWIGMVPEEWRVIKVKKILIANDGGLWGEDPLGDKNDKVVIRSTEQTIDGKWDIRIPAIRNLNISLREKYRIFPGDLLITKSSGSSAHIGKTTLADSYFESHECYFSNFIQRIRVCIEPKYVWYLFNSDIVRLQFVYLQNSTSGLGNLNSENIRNAYIPLPSKTEQKHISTYLDICCTKIDKIISDAKASIEEYKAWKSSIIYEAVTKGLDPTAEMKDSGVAWLEQIPTHVNISRVGLQFDIILGKMLCPEPRTRDDTLEKYYCAANVHFDGVSQTDLKQMWFNSAEKERYLVKQGDLLVVEGGAGAGGCAICSTLSKESIYIQNSIMIVRPRRNVDTHYLKYLIEFLVTHGYVDFVCNKATIPHFTKEKLANVPFPMFTHKEQKNIAQYLDGRCSKIDELIAEKSNLISDLESYKKSLIYEVVTGKRKVC